MSVDDALRHTVLFEKGGRVTTAAGPLIRAMGDFTIGEICSISRAGRPELLAEVVGFRGAEAVLTPYGVLDGVSQNSRISAVSSEFQIPVGSGLVGRVIGATGLPIDGRGPIVSDQSYPGLASPPPPMTRPIIDTSFSVGVRAIDGVLTIGEGQRVGVFAAAGGGKSTLMAMLVKFAAYDRCVISLIGERGREVREFVDGSLGPEGLAKSVLVIATADRPAIEQVKAAYSATAIAEYFRDKGERVLLLMDSLTRFARAQRQIGLAAGEPPTRRGFPPSVFEKLPGLLERGGLSARGSITAFYTVLVEGDDMNEPVADETRSLLDGHIVLSRKLANAGRYPAIDILSSASRVLTAVVDPAHAAATVKLRGLLAKYQEIELLVQIGEYVPGADALADDVLERKAAIDAFLSQRTDERSDFATTRQALLDAVGDA